MFQYRTQQTPNTYKSLPLLLLLLLCKTIHCRKDEQRHRFMWLLFIQYSAFKSSQFNFAENVSRSSVLFRSFRSAQCAISPSNGIIKYLIKHFPYFPFESLYAPHIAQFKRYCTRDGSEALTANTTIIFSVPSSHHCHRVSLANVMQSKRLERRRKKAFESMPSHRCYCRHSASLFIVQQHETHKEHSFDLHGKK